MERTKPAAVDAVHRRPAQHDRVNGEGARVSTHLYQPLLDALRRQGVDPQVLDNVVKETLRPMLKEWLDQNLPQLVERYVEREIVRLTRR